MAYSQSFSRAKERQVPPGIESIQYRLAPGEGQQEADHDEGALHKVRRMAPQNN